MKRARRSVWHERSLAGKRGRPRSCPKRVWYERGPARPDRSCIERRNGWAGGRDRDKPRKVRYHLARGGRVLGGMIRYADGAEWVAYASTPDGDVERRFWHRRDAKRWVEGAAARGTS